ncbi:MAG: hypothetical protein ACOYEA_07645 [Fermentimonas sp.]|jgi:hypothetical protein
MKQIEIKTPMELFMFVDEYFESMTEEDKSQLLREVLGSSWLVVFCHMGVRKTSIADLKLEFGAILYDDFNKNDCQLLTPLSDSFDRKFIEPLSRPTTPEQLEYIKWLRDYRNDLSFAKRNYEAEDYPDHVKRYLGIK